MFDRLGDRMGHYLRLMRLDRPIGTMLLLWPTLWALWIAGRGQPKPAIVLIFIVGTFVMRSAGCVINDFADREFDPHVERTQQRPLATGAVSTKEALILFVVLSLVGLALVLMLNRLALLLAVIGAVLAASYPFLKRFTHLPQFYLGIAFGWGIPMAFAALTGKVPLTGWLLLVTNICWAVAYDTWYAMVDRADDLKIGVKSTAVLFGRHDRLIVGVFQCATLGLLLYIGWLEGLNGYYFLGVLVATCSALHQQWLCWERDREKCFQAFLENSWFGAAIFTGILLAYL